jgi:predicted nucleic acid-binding Zn ribbon protein
VKRSTRKPTPGAKAGPEALGEIMSRLFTARGWGRKLERLRLEQSWAEAAGPTIARATRVGYLRRGVLEVIVESPVVLQELAHYQKKRLLEALAARTGSAVTDLRFHVGVLSDKVDAPPPQGGISRE